MSRPSNERSCTVTTERPAPAERQGVLEVRELRLQPPRAAAAARRPSAPPEARRELDRLDPVGDELGTARDRGELEVGRDAGKLAEQVRDVGLVARALPAENVGVDQDHATSS